MSEKDTITKRKMSETDIKDEKVEELKTVAAVTTMLTENPQMTKEITSIFMEAEMEKQRKIVEGVTKLLAERVTEVTPEQIKAAFSYWYLVSSPSPRYPPKWIVPTVEYMRPQHWVHS